MGVMPGTVGARRSTPGPRRATACAGAVSVVFAGRDVDSDRQCRSGGRRLRTRELWHISAGHRPSGPVGTVACYQICAVSTTKIGGAGLTKSEGLAGRPAV